jgi:hypothetical protein
VVQVQQGSLYPALHRLERRGWLRAKWTTTENNRKAKYYEISAAGRRQLAAETESWRKLADAIARPCGRCGALLGSRWWLQPAGYGDTSIATSAGPAAIIGAEMAGEVDARILLFTMTISIGSGIFFGIVPALRSTRVRPPEAFDSASAGLQQAMSNTVRRPWFGNSLVVAQVALAVVLLIGAGLFMRTLINLKSINTDGCFALRVVAATS